MLLLTAAERLAAFALALLGRLRAALRPLAVTGPLLPVVVPLCAAGAAWLPLRPLGLPGDYAQPQSGGEP